MEIPKIFPEKVKRIKIIHLNATKVYIRRRVIAPLMLKLDTRCR
jgi:hypothetical protein